MRCVCGCGVEITPENQGVYGACDACTRRLHLVRDVALSLAYHRDDEPAPRERECYHDIVTPYEKQIYTQLHGTVKNGRGGIGQGAREGRGVAA